MLRKFAGVLLATALIAGPAFAAQSTDNAGSTTTAALANNHAVSKHTKHTKLTKPTKMVGHVQKHVHKHVTHGKIHTMKQARHLKPTTTHKSHLAKTHLGKSRFAKTAKVTKG
jgi:hypothetical protein